MKRVYVEEGLGNIKQYLAKEGFQLVSKEEAEALVVTGLNSNILGNQKTNTPLPVVICQGQSPREISAELKERLDF